MILIVLQEPNGTPSNVQVKLANPEVASAANPLKVTGVRYQPFDPVVPLNVPAKFGSWVSTFAVKVPISELSRNEESAQYEKLLFPWFNGTPQLAPVHANVCPLSVPSMAMML